MTTSAETLRRLAWVLAVLAIAAGIMTLMYTFVIFLPPPPPESITDLVERAEAWRLVDGQLFPFIFVWSMTTLALFLVAAVVGAALRAWARPSALRDAMVLLFVIGGAVGVVSEIVDIAVSNAATFGICDCLYRTEELIAQDYALSIGWTVAMWLSVAAVTLTGIGVALAGRLVDVSSLWRTVSYAIAFVLLLAVAIRVIAAFTFIAAFDPFQISDLLVGLGAGILVPIWAILLARGLRSPGAEAAA